MRLPLALALLILVAPGTVLADDDVGGDDAPDTMARESLKIANETLELASAAADEDAAIKEYIPAGQKLDNWTKLAAVRVQTVINDPQQYADGVIEELKKQDPQAQYELLANPKTGDVILDFTVWSPDRSIVEFNVFQYQKHPDGGLVSHQYALRAYGDDAEEFVAGLDAEKRIELVAAVVAANWPAIEKDDGSSDDD